MPLPTRPTRQPARVPNATGERRRATSRTSRSSGPDRRKPRISGESDRLQIRDLLGNFSDQIGSYFQ